MLVALMADIHANREALEACLTHARAANVERYVFLGDYVGYGADPGWVVDQIMAYVENGASAIVGNHDEAVFAPSDRMNPTAQEAIDWTRGKLGGRQREFLEGLPLALEEGEGERLFVHANAWSPDGWNYILGPAEAKLSLDATRCSQTFCGHVHIPAAYHVDADGGIAHFRPAAGVEIPLHIHAQWLAVIGSVGQPRDHNPAACYALLDDERQVLTYVRVPYDTQTAARKVREAGLPLILGMRLERGY
jgi:diadenosine tetraphosphatase ApaH/serine/threonine PP2A family protein phosphatase